MESPLVFKVSMRILKVLKMLKHESGYREDRIILAVDEERGAMEIRSVSGYYTLLFETQKQNPQMGISMVNDPNGLDIDEDDDYSMYECERCGSL